MVRKVTDALFIGSKLDAKQNIDKFDIIISMEELPNHQSEEFIINDDVHDYNVFKNSVDFVLKSLNKNKSVLVHCEEGISRSVSVCIAAYVIYYDKKYKQACQRCFHKKHSPTIELKKSAKRYISENK